MSASLQVTLKSTLALTLITLLLAVTTPVNAAVAQQHVTLQEPAPTPKEDDKDKDDDWADIEIDICHLLGTCVNG